ncbi:MAG: 3-keto-5-aminohexanoate cleavage protein [Desulfobacterales bacterium]|nr:3-keto-5-aminohexanoate cleavage protein [Desulfobacterales bacterium]
MKHQKARKIIVAVAPTGKKIKPPSTNPLTPQDVAQQVIACEKAGASMVHMHVRDQQGEQTEDITDFSATLDLIRKDSDIVIQGSTGGLTDLTLEQRCVALDDARVEVASLNMGSINFGEDVYVNRMPDIRYWARRIEESHVVPELEIFAAGMLPAYIKLLEEGVLKAPYSIGFVLGVRWALPANAETLLFMKTLLPEKDVPWGVIHAGMKDFSLLATAIGMGAAVVRVGFEDSPYFASGKAAETNAELVERIVSLIHQMGFEVATCDEAREILEIGK